MDSPKEKRAYPCNYVDTLATLSYPCNVVLPAPAQSLIVGPRSRGKRELNERSKKLKARPGFAPVCGQASKH